MSPKGNMMIKKVLLILPLILACQNTHDSLDDLRAFKPDKKYFKADLKSLHFIIETSPITEVDTMFLKILNLYKIPLDAKGCADGTFFGASPYDAYDYKHVIKLQIKNERIISADYNEIHIDGNAKQEDSTYCAAMRVAGTTPAIAYPMMEKQLLDTQNMMDVDAVTGATYSLYRFRYATMTALVRARLRK